MPMCPEPAFHVVMRGHLGSAADTRSTRLSSHAVLPKTQHTKKPPFLAETQGCSSSHPQK
jgi:hypothetical protein